MMSKNKKDIQEEIKEENESLNENMSDNEVRSEEESAEQTQAGVDSSEEQEEELSEEQKRINELEIQLKETNDKFLRLYSEFDNYKKRTQKERAELFKTAGEDIFVNLLPVLDDFDRAVQSFEETEDVNALKEGVNLIHHKFRNTLEQKGLEPMDSKGKEFDTDLHEAVTNTPAPSDDMKGKVVDVLERGYLLNGKVIRYAKVVVGS